MKKEVLHDLIERYLNGDLSETERREVERRLANDAGFRAEVALQQALQTHFGNPSEVRLRSALDDMWKDITVDPPQPAPKPGPAVQVWLRYLAAAAAVALLVAAWWWFWPSPPTTREQPAAEKPAFPAPIQEPIQDQHPQTPPEQDRPIAMANPSDFAPNPALDMHVGGARGGDGTSLELLSPAAGAAFRLKNGRITLPVKGTVHANPVPTDQPLRLFVYSNRPKDWENKQSLFDLPFPLEPVGQGQYRADFSRQLQLRPGLYYLVVGQRRPPEADGGYRTLWVGKFTAK